MPVTTETAAFLIVTDRVNVRILPQFAEEVPDHLHDHVCIAFLRFGSNHIIEV